MKDDMNTFKVRVTTRSDYKEHARKLSGSALEKKVSSESKMIDKCKLTSRLRRTR